jgi:membrane-associated HD superfamily phosphohydrolase
MKPGTKETAILMVVDSIEAASRTLDSPEREPLEDMVRRIVFAKLAAEQLDESGLTMKELRIVCSRVVETLVHMNHHRIKYPWQEERARQFGVGTRELSPLVKAPAYPRVVAEGA